MPLERYQQKRDFAKTPEPTGGRRPEAAPGVAGPRVAAPTGPGHGARFVVQRHRASRLHYDFRLEVGGVLVSWAVPRGPTLDPAEKRMAIHVEDHPIEYLDFEGVIPARQYGAGDVIVWDWGTFTAEPAGTDPAEAIRAGELKFHLFGEKLRGRFTIVRTTRRPAAGRKARATAPSNDLRTDGSRADATVDEAERGDQWLLIHKRGATAVAGWDAEAHPRSVKSGRTNDEVKAGADALWISDAPLSQAAIDLSAARPAAQPSFIEPMLAETGSRPFSHPDWLYEIKWDGFRVQAIVRDGTVRFKTRNGHDAAGYFPELAASRPNWIEAEQAIVDGEVVALTPAGVPDFGLLQTQLARRAGEPSSVPIVYEVFDLLYLDGRLLVDVPLEDRKNLLRSVIRDTPRVRYAGHISADGEAFHATAVAQHLEGILAKHRRSRYEPGRRVTTWLKLKIRPEQELVVGGFTPAKSSPADLGALLVGVYEGPQLRYAGRVGTGWDTRTRRDILATAIGLETGEPPFEPPPERTADLAGVRWVEPRLVIRAELGGWSVDGLVRQASFKGLAPDRDPRSVKRELPIATEEATRLADAVVGGPSPSLGAGPAGHPQAATPEERAAFEAIGREGLWRIGGDDLKLTNLDKVLFPPAPGTTEPPITKRELIRYFLDIAPILLPHLADRPLNMNRYPDGVGGKSFWQKDIPATAPRWLRRWREVGVDEREANQHLVADRVGALAWLGNQAAFEFHPWTSKLDAPDRPTFALIDIDPGELTSWEEVLVLARLYRTALEHLTVRGYPKTTGKRGLQIWIPVERVYSYRDTSGFVENLSRAIGALVPDLVSWEWSVGDRKGRARLDYTQNAYIKTLVGPYAVRPLPGAPVSTPISWDELDDPAISPTRWTIRSLTTRVAARGDLFAGALTDAQRLPPLG